LVFPEVHQKHVDITQFGVLSQLENLFGVSRRSQVRDFKKKKVVVADI
jgi:hypothetical protein